MITFSENQKNILGYIVERSMDTSAKALSEMIHREISLESPKLGLISLSNIVNEMGGSDNLVTCICLSFKGDVAGLVSIILSEESAFKLVDILLGNELGVTSELDEMGKSALGEVGNIVVSHFLRTLSTHTWLDLQPSVPMVVMDMAGAILSSLILNVGESPEEILFSETVFSDKSHDIDSKLFLFAAPSVLKKIFEVIEAK
ncbi:MAG TPA: hypothetical protein ENN38_06600 [Actinobacteria bacterium]|nr:hypothetical protein [Actinomycetota bacterium]